jgi:Tol biopolymer transport system component
VVCDWSADGQFLLYKQFDDQSGTTDLWALPMQGNKTPFPVAQGPADERDGQISADGKWVAYDSDESGRPAIYIQPFPERGEKQRVSTAGGSQPRWRSDGRELFYVAPDGYLMAVPMGNAAGSSSVGTPVRLFKTRLAPVSAISRQQYAVATEGQRFLMIATDDVPTPPITLILNWKDRSRP